MAYWKRRAAWWSGTGQVKCYPILRFSCFPWLYARCLVLVLTNHLVPMNHFLLTAKINGWKVTDSKARLLPGNPVSTQNYEQLCTWNRLKTIVDSWGIFLVYRVKWVHLGVMRIISKFVNKELIICHMGSTRTVTYVYFLYVVAVRWCIYTISP